MTTTKTIHPTTQEVLDAIAQDTSDRIVSCMYSFCWPRANVSAAFRIANQTGLIVRIGTGGNNNPIYKLASR